MAHQITDSLIGQVSILAKLSLTGEERAQAAKDMETMLVYVDLLNELNTDGVAPMTHLFPAETPLREDVVTGEDRREEMLANAPARKDHCFQVPKTVE